MQKDTFAEISSTLQCQNIPQGIHKNRKPLFPQLETTKPLKKTKNVGKK